MKVISPKISHPLRINYNVLTYREKSQWVALALEMDLRGYGDTQGDAIKEMMDLVRMQVSFALSKNEPHMIWCPAEAHWFQLFAEVRSKKITYQINPAARIGDDFDVGSFPMPIPPVSSKRMERFSRADA